MGRAHKRNQPTNRSEKRVDPQYPVQDLEAQEIDWRDRPKGIEHRKKEIGCKSKGTTKIKNRVKKRKVYHQAWLKGPQFVNDPGKGGPRTLCSFLCKT